MKLATLGYVDRRSRIAIVLPFVVGALLPFIFAAVLRDTEDLGWLIAAGCSMAVFLLVVAAAVAIEVDRRVLCALAILYLPIMAMARHAQGGGPSGFAPLVFIPLIVISLYGSRRALYVCIGAIALTLVLPIVLIGPPEYAVGPESRRTATLLAMSLIIGPAVQRLVHDARANELRYRSVFENVHEVIFQTDVDGNWTLLNPAWQHITGYDVTTSIGRPFIDFVHPDDRAANAEQFHMLRDRNIDTYTHEMRYLVASGEYRWLEVTAHRTRTPDGEPGGVSGTLTDITARYEADRLKEEFFALISHELRTPLAAIIGYLELLDEEERERLSPDGQEFVDVMRRNSQRLMRLIGDLLFTAQVEAGTLALVRGPTELDDVVRHACDTARPQAEDRDLRLECDIADGLTTITADKERLGQVLDNLLTNAIKFTPPGGSIAVRASEDAATTVLEVSDTGEGISEADQDRLFERFARAQSAEQGAVQGVGLGLAITQAIVVAHGGRIGIQSELGHGTTFRVELPKPARDEEAE